MTEVRASGVDAWRQGDYSLDLREFPHVSEVDPDGLAVIDAPPVIGVVVVTQTCDIVNSAPGKEHVVVCPLLELTEQSVENVRKGRSPAAAVLECPPSPGVVADLGRMVSIHKSVLAGMERREGFVTDGARTRFAEALERKHGRFAFPDAFNDHVLAKLRDRVLGSHGKEASDPGKAYRSVRTVRVSGTPGWDAPQVEVLFHVVLMPEEVREASRAEIAKTLDEHLKKIIWPKGFVAAKPAFVLTTMAEMTAADWTCSQSVDWDFISRAGSAIPNG